MTDPERWLVSSDAPPELRELLRRARSDFPPPEQVAAVGSRLGLASKGATVASFFGKGAFVLAALSLGAVSAYWFTREGETPKADAGGPTRAAVVETEVAPRAATRTETTEPAPSQPSELSAELPREPGNQPKGERLSPKVPLPLPREVDLIREARKKLDLDPEAALRKLREHEKLFPRGVLAEEREVLRVRALARSGQTKAAQEKAAQFEKSHPNSAHQLDR